MKRKITFIINPTSGKKLGKNLKKMIVDQVDNHLNAIDIVETEKAFHAIELTQQAISNGAEIIVACGGDGTINEVAQQLVNTTITLGIIPIGSGNGLATNLNIPKDLNQAIQSIFNFNAVKIDVGQIDKHYFFSNIGFGIDAEVIKNYADSREHSFIGYFKASLKTFFNYRPRKLKLVIDHQDTLENEYFFMLCSNSNMAGYGISFTPSASLNDGKLDLLAVKKLRFIETIQFAFGVLNQTLKQFTKANYFQLEEFKIEALDRNLIIQIDGETLREEKKRVEVKILKKALSILVP